MDIDGPGTDLPTAARFAARLAGLLAGLLVVSSCTAAPEPADKATDQPGPAATAGQRYADSQVGFSIVPPARWRAQPSPGANPVVTFFEPSPDDSGGAPVLANLVVVVTGTDEGLDANLSAARQQLPGALPNYQPATDERTQLSDGTPAHLLGGTYLQRGVELRNLQLVVVADNSCYVATATTSAARFDSYRDVVLGSLLTFSPRGG